MRNVCFNRDRLGDWLMFATRLLLGTIFIIAAIFKLPHQSEFIQIVIGYGVIPGGLAEIYAILLPWAELLLGLFLILGFLPRISTALLSLITVSFIIANVHAIIQTSGTLPCGCFGDLIPLTHTQSLIMDFLMLLTAVPLLMTRVHPFVMSRSFASGLALKCSALLVIVVMLAGLVPAAVIVADSSVQEDAAPAIEEGTESDTPVLIFFYADFCSYCQQQKPVIDELEALYANRITFLRFATSDNADIVEEWNIQTIPTIVLAYSLNTTDECTRFTGLTEQQTLVDALDAMLAETCPAPVDIPESTAAAITADPSPLDTSITTSLASGKPVFLFFYAEWCGYCQRQHPIINELEQTYGNEITFIRAESEAYSNDLEQWGVTSFPSMFIISGIDNAAYTYLEFSGYTEQTTLSATLDEFITTGILPAQIIDVGSENPDLTDLDKEIDISLVQGNPVFLFFYSETCHYCQEQHPIVTELKATYGDRVTFISVRDDDYPGAMVDWGVTSLPDMFLVTDLIDRSYTYQEFNGLTEKNIIAESIDYLLKNGVLPEGTEQTGYVHHSCSTGKCVEGCLAKAISDKADELGWTDLAYIERAVTDVALDCLSGSAREAFDTAYSAAKIGDCAYACASADSPREAGNCVQCAIENTLGKVPVVGCAVDIANIISDVILEPVADCLAECAADSSMWQDTYGHECRNHQGNSSRCVGSNVMEALECVDCEWVPWKVYTCDGGCEMTPDGAACKGKCNETDCDDGDDCTIDWCYDGECRHEQKIGEGCSCPESCDDGNPCTEDFCDENFNCQHTKKPGCCPTSCNDGDHCTRDWCDGNGSCQHSRVPGCDHPDDNNDYSTFPEYDVLPVDDNSDIAVLNNGFADSAMAALGKADRTAALIDPSLYGIHNFGILIIPSGGLAGLDTSELFRERLWNYVENGGTLIVFTQQQGGEFEMLPGGEVRGYGWNEDQACNGASVGMTQYHPLLSGMAEDTPHVNVDGFFTTYPLETSVLLTRLKNGQPAMILYGYGEGQVLATTLYPDMSESLYQNSYDEQKLFRDLLSWAEAESDIDTYGTGTIDLSIPVFNPQTGSQQGTIPEYSLGNTLDITMDVVNTGNSPVDKITFMLYDPRYNLEDSIDVSQTIAVNATENVTLTYQTAADMETGVWTIYYFLYSGDELNSVGIGQKFTLGYDIAAAAQFQGYVTVTDPLGQMYEDVAVPLTIPPGETGSLGVSLDIPDFINNLGIWHARYSVLDSEGNVLMSSTYPFAVSRWANQPEGWVYQAQDINYSITSDKEAYIEGENGTFTIHFWNRSDTERTVTVWYSFPHNYWENHDDIYGAGTTSPGLRSSLYRTVVIPARQGDTDGYDSFDYTVPIYSYDRLWAEFYEGDETSHDLLGRSSRGIYAYKPRVYAFLDFERQDYAPGEDATVTVQLKNDTGTPLDYFTTVSLVDSDGVVLVTDNYSGTAQPGLVSDFHDVTLTIPADTPLGNYRVVVQAYVDSIVVGGVTGHIWLTHLYSTDLSLDAAGNRYAAGQTVHIQATMTNRSTAFWESDVRLEVPAAGYDVTTHVALAGSESQIITYDVTLPDSIGKGIYQVQFSVPADGYVDSEYIYIPASHLVVTADQSEVTAGEDLVVTVANTGGIDTTARCAIFLLGAGSEQTEQIIDVPVDQPVSLTMTVPVSMPGGTYTLTGYCVDQSTAQSQLINRYIEVLGSELTVSLETGTTYTAGDTLSFNIDNTGGIDTGYECTVNLWNNMSSVLRTDDYAGSLLQGESTVLDFTLPAQITSGTYYLDITCTDTSQTKSRLYEPLTINGLEFSLTSVTDQDMYVTSATVTLQSHLDNAGPALMDGSLKLKIWQTVESEIGGGSEVSQDKVATYTENRKKSSDYSITRDESGNVYIAGSVYDDNGRVDYLTIKYNAQLTQQWARIYKGTAGLDDYAEAIAVDADGNVYVTGRSMGEAEKSLEARRYDILTVMYDSEGNFQWDARYDVAGNEDSASDVGVDANGNVYVTGYGNLSMYGNSDYITLKYSRDRDSEDSPVWVRNYDGPAGTGDYARAIFVDSSGNVYVTGSSYGETSYMDIATIMYSSAGEVMWNPVPRYEGTGYSFDEPQDITVDAAGNVYVTGVSDADFVTIKYNPSGTEMWARGFAGPYAYDIGQYVAVDNAGNVYVTGDCEVSGEGEMVINGICSMKYDIDGNPMWSSDTAIIENEGSSMTYYTGVGGLSLDADGNPYITGTVLNADGNPDAVTIKYNPANGSETWRISYGSPVSEDFSTGILVGSDNAVYVVGYSDFTGDAYATTIKYVQGGGGTTALEWEKTLPDPIDVGAGGNRGIDTPVTITGDLQGVTGKLYHVAELYNADGQLIATSDTHTFYIVDSGLALTLETDKEFYRPGETVQITGEVVNTAAAADSGTLTVTVDGTPVYTTPFDLQAGESLGFSTSAIAGSTDFLLEGTTDTVSVSDIIEVRPYNVDVEIMAPDIVGLDPFGVILSIVNNSDDYYDNVHVALDNFGSWDASLPPGDTVLLDTEVQIAATSTLTASLTGDVVLAAEKLVIMGESAGLTVTPAVSYPFGTVDIPFMFDNTGLLDVFADINFSIDGQAETITVFAAAGTATMENISFELSPGTYTLEYQSIYGSGMEEIVVTGGPEFEVTEYPDNLDLVVGDPTWNFTVKNTGGSGGFLEFYLQMPDWEDTQFAWLEAGEEIDFIFVFDIPDDLEAGVYTAYIEVNEVRYNFSFNVEGPKLFVMPSLDKDLYEAGDIAVLTLDIENISDFDLELFARVNLGDHEEIVDFALDAGATTMLQFSIPAVFDHVKLFYGIYQTSGRALHLNALYIYERGPLDLYTDAQVYDIGDTVTINMVAPQAGTVNITAPGYEENITLPAGTTQRQFILPDLVTGTYYIDYIFEGEVGRYPFDVRGYSARITDFDLNESTYRYGDKLTVIALTDASKSTNASMSCTIQDEWGNMIQQFGVSQLLEEGLNVINAETAFTGTVAGLYSARCQVFADLSGGSLMLASAIQYFDANGTNTVPMSNAGMPYSATEGSLVLFDAAGSYDSNNDALQYRWDFENDGVFDTDWSPDSSASHMWPDDWTGRASVQVSDGHDISEDTVIVNINNVPPTASLSAWPVEIDAGETVTFSGSFSDYGVDDTHTVVWDFGDGTTAAGSLDVIHRYTSGGTFTASITVTDDDGGSGWVAIDITVNGSSNNTPGGMGGGSAAPVDQNEIDEDEGNGDEPPAETNTSAEFNIGSFKISSGAIFPGDTFTIKVDVSNDGGTADRYLLELELNGIVVQSQVVNLSPGERRTVQFSIVAGEPGTYLVEIGGLTTTFEVLELGEVAGVTDFQISDLTITPEQAVAGDPVTVTAIVTNHGNNPVSDTITLFIDGQEEDSKVTTLDPGDSAMLSFTIKTENVGIYDVTLGSLKGTFEVILPNDSAPDENSDETRDTLSWIWVGVIIGVVVVIGIVIGLLYLRRRGKEMI